MESLTVRFKAALDHRRARLVVILTALALVSPSLASPLLLDDHIFELLSRPDPGIRGFHSRPFDLLTFTTGVPADNRALMDEGALLPWWAHERHTNSLFRPLSVLTHRIDVLLWPGNAWAMHAHSLVWFLVLLLVVSRLYERIGPGGWVSTLALLMFAWDDVHGPTIAWIANRNAVIAMLCAAAAILFHHRSRDEDAPRRTVAAAVFVALALLAAESGITVYAYLFAYALCFDRKGWRSGLVALWPYVVVAVGWRVLYKHGGYGTFASEVYLDPGTQPLVALGAILRNLPCLLASQFGPGVPFADLILWVPASSRAAILVFAWLDVALMLWICAGALRESRTCRFWGLGLLLAAVPLTASASGDRLLLPVSIGASALTAEVVAWFLRALSPSSGSHTTVTGPSRTLYQLALAALILVNVIEAPLCLPFRTYAMGLIGRAAERADAGIPKTADIVDDTVVVMNAPVDVLVSYVQLARARTHTPRPRHLYWLATSSSPFSVERVGPNELRLTKPRGLLYTLPERHYRASWLPFRRGDEVALTEMRAKIVDLTADGRPSTVDFTFEKPLENSRYVFLTWNDAGLVPYALPAVGAHTDFAEEGFFDVMFGRFLKKSGPTHS